MRFKLIAVLLTGFAVAACTTPGEESASMSSTQGAIQGTDSAMLGKGPAVSSQRVAPSVRPGTAEDFTINVGDRVFFGFDKFALTQEAREILEKQSSWLSNFPNVTVTITGHADERGTREYNLALGEKRSAAVKNYLIALGVDPNRIRTISFGKERPVDPRSQEAAWARNRRGVTVVDESDISMNK